MRDYLAKNHGDSFDRTFGKGNGKAIMHATAGSLIGIGEIVILPLDVLKIKAIVVLVRQPTGLHA